MDFKYKEKCYRLHEGISSDRVERGYYGYTLIFLVDHQKRYFKDTDIVKVEHIGEEEYFKGLRDKNIDLNIDYHEELIFIDYFYSEDCDTNEKLIDCAQRFIDPQE